MKKPQVIMIVVGLLSGLTAGSIGSKKLIDQRSAQHDEVMLYLENRHEEHRLKQLKAIWDKNFNGTEDNLTAVTNWIGDAKDMPATKQRVDFAKYILEVTDDNTITDDERESVYEKYKTLLDVSQNIRTNENATKIQAGEDIDLNEGDKETLENISINNFMNSRALHND